MLPGGEEMPLSTVIDPKNYSNYNYIMPYIRYCAEDIYNSDWHLKKRKISDYEFVFITAGTGRFTIDECIFGVKANDLVLFKPNKFHFGKSVTHPFSFICIHFDLYVSKTFNDIQGGQHLFESVPLKPVKYSKSSLEFPEFTTINDSGYINMLFRRILNEGQRKQAGYNAIIKALFTELLISLFRQKDNASTTKSNSPEILAVTEYIKQNYQNKISLSQLADYIHWQPTYLSSSFKRYTGYTVTDYIKHHRLSCAKSLLLETNRKIEDIAGNVGFYDLHHFSRVFKEHEGLTPIQYRQIKRV